MSTQLIQPRFQREFVPIAAVEKSPGFTGQSFMDECPVSCWSPAVLSGILETIPHPDQPWGLFTWQMAPLSSS